MPIIPVQYNKFIIIENQLIISNIYKLDINNSLHSSLIIENRSEFSYCNNNQILNKVEYLVFYSIMQQATFDYIEKIKVRKIDKVIKLLNSKIRKLDKKLDNTTIKYYSIEKYKIY